MAKIKPTEIESNALLNQNPLSNIGGPTGPVGIKYCGSCNQSLPPTQCFQNCEDDKLTKLCKRLHDPDNDCPDFLQSTFNCYSYEGCLASIIFKFVSSCLPESGIPDIECSLKLNGFKDRFLPYLKGPDGVDPCSYGAFTSNTTLVDCILERLIKTSVPPGVPEPIPGVYTDTKIEQIFRGLIKELQGTNDSLIKELGDALEILLKGPPAISVDEMRKILEELFKLLRLRLPN